jgi:sugar fermentation stimulation protein A
MPDNALQVRDGMICFPEPLTHAAIIRRRNRFIIDVDLGGAVVGCHCPTTGRIGTLVLDGLPCLLSASRNTARKTPGQAAPAPQAAAGSQERLNPGVEAGYQPGLPPVG